MGNPVGVFVYDLTSGFLGDGAFMVPVLLALLGWRFMRHPELNAKTSRAVIGWVPAWSSACSGCSVSPRARPNPPDGARRRSGGRAALSAKTGRAPRRWWPGSPHWVATPPLGLVAALGLLVITGTPVRHAPAGCVP